MHPHILMTAEPLPGLRSVDDIRRSTATGHGRILWERIIAAHSAATGAHALLPTSIIPDREPAQAAVANCDYQIVAAACRRILSAALVACLRGDPAELQPALTQLEAVFDESRWPDLRDLAHRSRPADLRHGQFAKAIALAYDWSWSLLTPERRTWWLNGLDRRCLQPILACADSASWFVPGPKLNNWATCIVGGLGIAGMALGEDYPDSGCLVALGDGTMLPYLDNYGPEGEFNESPGYSQANGLAVDYFAARRYHTRGADTHLAGWPFADACRWMLHQFLPPGRLAAYGDTHAEARPRLGFFAAVADAAKDTTLQAAYLYSSTVHAASDPVYELLAYNPDLGTPEAPPPISLPPGKAYRAHSACISHRLDWKLATTPIVVYGKGGHGQEIHGHHDAGQLCIDGHGEPLIIDLGTQPYPPDYFGANRYAYYYASVCGHNVLTFDDEETTRDPERAASITAAKFADGNAAWSLDLTRVYEGVTAVTRDVVTCGLTVAVRDRALLPRRRRIVLRWHTANRAAPDANGAFRVVNGPASLDALVAALPTPDGGLVPTLTRGEHCHRPPYHLSRIGQPLPDRHESFVQVSLESAACDILTLFRVGAAAEPAGAWRQTAGPAWEWQCTGRTWARVDLGADGAGVRVFDPGDSGKQGSPDLA